MNIYEEMLKVCDKEKISNHESDLYVPVTLRTTNIINMYQIQMVDMYGKKEKVEYQMVQVLQ